MNLKEEISEPLIRGKVAIVAERVKRTCELGEDVKAILEQGLLPGMSVVGERFKRNEMFIPEVLASAKAMHAGLDILKPLLVGQGVEPRGKVVIGTVAGDVHDIGKNIVAMMLEAGRFEVVDLGVDVSVEEFVEAVRAEEPEILAMSALLSTTMPMFKKSIQAVENAGLNVKIIVGGAQVTSAYAEEAGADAYAPNAVVAVEVVGKLVAEDLR